MEHRIFFYSLTLLLLTLNSIGQTKTDRLILGKSIAEKELKEALNGKTQLNATENKTIIVADSSKAVAIAEPILFKKYGKKHILNERPYESYLIDNYWVISGTLPTGYEGGTFLIIIDATDGKIIKTIHSQ